jgi:hypothetical protein
VYITNLHLSSLPQLVAATIPSTDQPADVGSTSDSVPEGHAGNGKPSSAWPLVSPSTNNFCLRKIVIVPLSNSTVAPVAPAVAPVAQEVAPVAPAVAPVAPAVAAVAPEVADGNLFVDLSTCGDISRILITFFLS